MPKVEVATAKPWVPAKPTLPKLVAASKHCEGCDLYKHATQTVFGAGPAKAPVIMVGEQPGDVEDREGAPFVGPAGRLLDKAMVEAGIDREQVYVTNAVKHFKFIERGKRRIHAKPNIIEIRACHPWLEAEIDVVKPELIVCLGATAAQALLGREFRITRQRGVFLEHDLAKFVMATVHPSSLLRAPDPERRHEEYRLFVQDLKTIPKRITAVRLSA
jgi:DNA polymerase